ncbi:MAG: hypothetical protein R2733_01855 [Acidimicrobiales bacterium]
MGTSTPARFEPAAGVDTAYHARRTVFWTSILIAHISIMAVLAVPVPGLELHRLFAGGVVFVSANAASQLIEYHGRRTGYRPATHRILGRQTEVGNDHCSMMVASAPIWRQLWRMAGYQERTERILPRLAMISFGALFGFGVVHMVDINA